MNKRRKFISNQEGMVAIAVTMIILTIVSLIVIGFATLSRREQRQALDRQLSSDAYYAAESGVNYIADQLHQGAITSDVTTCNDPAILTPVVKTLGNNVEYTCALVQQSVDSVDFKLAKDGARVVKLTSDQPIGSIEIDWQDADGTDNFACNNDHFLPQGSFTDDPANQYPGTGVACGPGGGKGSFSASTGILRATVIPITPSFSRDQLIQRSPTYFLYPKTNLDPTGQTNYAAANTPTSQGSFIDGKCTVGTALPRLCRSRITNVNGLNPGGTNIVYLRLRSIYRGSDIQVRVFSTAGAPLKINGEQAVVDVTARASDVLKRIRAKVPLGSDYYRPNFAIQTAHSLCKRFTTWPGGIQYTPFTAANLVRAGGGGGGTSDVDIDITKDNVVCDPTLP